MKNARVYYNKASFPDVLLVVIEKKKVNNFEKHGNVTVLFDEQKNIIGYNILISETLDGNGYLPMSETLLHEINEYLLNAHLEPLNYDFTPKIVVGRVIECVVHPDSDHLHVCKVDVGSEVLQIVCGAHNVKKDVNVVVALCGAILPDGTAIEKGKLRGIESYGMLCSLWELRMIDHKEKGIILLDDSYRLGEDFMKVGVR